MHQRFVRFWQSPRQAQWLFLQALIWLPLSHWGVRCFGFKRGCQRLARLPTSPSTSATPEQIRICEQALQRAIRYGLHPGNCLSRALTLWWLLRCQGVRSELHIGVRRVEGTFQAHAWVEHQGLPLNESPDVRQQYATFQDELFTSVARASQSWL